MSNAITDVEIDFNHPTIGAYGVCARFAGYLPIKEVLTKLKEHGVPGDLHPIFVGNSVALKRAMEDACAGDKTLRVESTGKASKVVYSILRTNKERINREVDSGTGVADAEVSARVEANGVGGLSLIVSPSNHPFTHYINERFDFHREHYKCSHDLSVAFTQAVKSKFIKGASRPGQAGGFYFVPKGDGLDILRNMEKAFNEVSYYHGNTIQNGVKIYFIPMLTQIQDVLDAIVDSVIDDALATIEDLKAATDPDCKLGARALGTKAARALELEKKLENFSASCSVAFTDIAEQVETLKKQIYFAEMRASMEDA